MCLPEEVEPGSVFSLRALDANLVHWHSEPLDTLVCGLYQSDGYPTIDLSARFRVRLLPLCCEATGYSFQGSR